MDNTTKLNAQSESHHLKNFTILYKQVNGSVLQGFVKQLSTDDYEVFVQEKDVIIRCARNASGILSCKLNGADNPDWLEGISRKLKKK